MVQLVVTVLGDPIPPAEHIVWYHNQSLITDQDQNLILSADRKRLTISSIGTRYYGIYRCYVMTTAGADSHNFTIERAGKAMKC